MTEVGEAITIEGKTQTYKAKTGLGVGRAVRQVIEDIDIETGVKTEKNIKRELIRHEVAHALGHKQELVEEHTVGGYFRIKEGDPQIIGRGIMLDTYVKETGVNTTISAIKSMLAPLGDKRIKQSLSVQDKHSLWENIKALFRR